MIEGTKVALGGKDYFVPALSWGAVRRCESAITVLSDPGVGVLKMLEAGVRVVGEAIRRNYPEMTDEMLEELIDTRNIRELIPMVMGVSGLTSPGEAAAAPAPLYKNGSTGESFTHSS